MNKYIRDNRVSSIRQYLKEELLSLYEMREADQMVKMLFHHYLGWSSTDLMVRQNQGLSESEILLLHLALKNLKKGIPVQYVMGRSTFMDLSLQVDPSVLIPRPETEELVRLILHAHAGSAPTILDVGTGSGCIGLALKKHLPQAQVTLLDASQEAIAIAKRNADQLGLDVQCEVQDILHFRSAPNQWDVIVSNPPYIPLSEKQEMSPTVVQHEPHMALFVSDAQPLLYYERILQIARIALKPQGKIYFEIHERMSDSLTKLCKDYGLTQFRFHRDMQGKDRMLVIG